MNGQYHANLVAHQIPLIGKHLIEASAGTGKTYNITRIYLRLLLEQQLTVEQILVMTFTKDATEELRGRISLVLRESLANWDSLIVSDDFYKALASHVEAAQAKRLLKQALLFLDESAIFTLHGFCKRVLSQHAFSSGLAFNLDMDTSGKDLLIEATQDWYRLLAKHAPEQYLRLTQFWSVPNSFIQDFANAIGKSELVDEVEPQKVVVQFKRAIRQTIKDINEHRSFIVEHLIDSKKGKDREIRLLEFEQLLNWLTQHQEKEAMDNFIESPFPAKFMHGGRFPKGVKPQLVEIFSQANQLKTSSGKLQNKIEKAIAFQVVKQGIDKISGLIADKKAQRERMTFDDLIDTLSHLLKNERSDTSSSALAKMLRIQYPAALVDEFQDTDPAQFNILSAIYPKELDHPLFLIGDPKQAIYGFRGGDIHTYLAARNYCQYQWMMDTNWRSTTHMVSGYNRIFYGTHLADEGTDVFGADIPYQPVKASPTAVAKASELNKIDDDKALSFIYFQPEDEAKPVKQTFRPVMAQWCATKITQLLKDEDTPYRAQDIAILVRDGSEADEMSAALSRHQLSSVFLSNKANLWHSEEAQQLVTLLKAVVNVENDRYFVAGLACGLLPYHHERMMKLQQDELAWQSIKFQFLALREDWLYRGFIAMGIKLLHHHIKVAPENKNRTLTNIIHLLELLQTASQKHRQPLELLYWFEQQISAEIGESEAEVRLESDDELIKIVTQHGSKGLEYPVVFIPFSSRYKNPKKVGIKHVNVIEYHDASGEKRVALGADSEHADAMAHEAYLESVRLLYVAITRAERQCYVLVTAFDDYHLSPLGQTLKWQKQEPIVSALEAIANDQPDNIGLQVVDDVDDLAVPKLTQQIASQTRVSIPDFKGKIERDWWLSSFTALSRNLRHVGVSLPDRDNEDFQIDASLSANTQMHTDMRFNLVKGAAAGNLLHEIFEHTDFSTESWREELMRYFDKSPELLSEWRPSELAQWLTEIIHCPLIEEASFKDLNSTHMLKEAEFYFPMINVKTVDLTNLLTDHRKANPWLNTMTRPVSLPNYHALKGMMHGFIDLIFEHKGKYYVCDYKSNYLGDSAEDYSTEKMAEAVESHHYDLQYLIYTLALHRQLKNSVKDYDPSLHLGGAFYLFLRGVGAKLSKPELGVYYRKIDEKTLNQLDKIFCGEHG